jgi:protein-S-isoprenylcysteine O-methyltransferase Ste14
MSDVVNRQGGANVRVPPPLVFVAGMVLGWLLGRHVHAFPLPLGRDLRMVLAVAALLGALGLLGSALGLFARSGQAPEPWKPTPSIVAAGPYRFTRNPMYLGMLLLQVAVGLWRDNAWIVLLAGPALAAVHVLAVLPEERYLRHKFGESYERYMATVPRYLGPRR